MPQNLSFETLANSISQLAWVADPTGSIYWYNQRWYDYTGTTLDQMRGWGWQASHHPDHVDRVVKLIRTSFENGTPWEDTFPLRGRDNKYRWFLSRALPIKNDAGEITHWFGTNTDITDQLILKDQAHADAAFLHNLLQNSPDCIKVLDLDGSLRSMSAGGLAVMEIDDFAPYEGVCWLDFWKGPHIAAAKDALAAARQGGVGRFRGHAPTAKGTMRFWDVRIIPIKDKDGKFDCLLSISRDATAEYDAETSLQEMNASPANRVRDGAAALTTSDTALRHEASERETAQAQVRQLQKMDAVGQLTGGIAHDFNNMLAVTLGALNLIERRLKRGEDVGQLITAAIDGTMNAATLTRQLLAFSRQLPLAPQVVDVNKTVQSMASMLRRSLGEQIFLESVLGAGLWNAYSDPVLLENAVLNLAVNGRDAMPNGGRLTIETANTRLDEAYAYAHEDVMPGQYVMIAVSDTGSGMRPEIAAKAFEPFFTTKVVGKGLGLGLSQIYGYVKQSKGHVKIYSEVSQGTSIKIYLPRHFGKAAIATDVLVRPIAASGSLSEVVLLVEDDERMRNVSAATLRELGYTVIHTSSGNNALDILKTRSDVALLFTDIVMPEMNGRELSEAALKVRPNMKVLYTTGYTRNAIVHNGVLDEGINFIAKPFTIDQLAQKLREVLDAR